jgi:phosphoribosylamine---glycine ligase
MRVLVVGSGGREHALVWKLAQSPLEPELHAAPGNPGIAALATLHPVAAADLDGVTRLAAELAVDLVVVGPEAPLVAGLADRLAAAGLRCFGPRREAARIEGSKAFAKSVMDAAGVPTARYAVCDTVAAAQAAIAERNGRVVVKADGLAAGKGVTVCHSAAAAEAAARECLAEHRFGEAGRRVLVEELLEGPELSLLALCDGERVVGLPPARDYKRAHDGDAGPNTGGMGSLSPVPGIDAGELERIVRSVHLPVVNELARRGTPFRGCLYAGLMLTSDGPRVLEFNVRFGDPETQAVLPRLGGDLLAALYRAASGALEGDGGLHGADAACASVVLAGRRYPEAPDHGTPIDGVEEAGREEGVTVFHAGTALEDGRLVTDGGRVLNVSAVGADPAAAADRAYAAVERISFAGMHYRRDVGGERVAKVPSG